MSQTSFIRKIVHYDIIQRILKQYQCPASCNSHCCKNGKVHLFEEEKESLLRLRPDKKRHIAIEKDVSYLYTIDFPCVFLDDSHRCEVYVERPLVCGLYPFKVSESRNDIGLQPCPIGYSIIKDFSKWVVGSLAKMDDVPLDKKRQIKESWELKLDLYSNELTNFFTNSSISEISIPLNDLELFSIYLDEKLGCSST
ncbi:YkgJ family cysteine cluster protein [Methanosalsum natronophilum]|nr:YkgJ family cysteine cluster protein [Methanosalsum natronophilum]MCS3923796.1 Fe-S-cluster containining protein [Methanosalsum natronophilum]